MGEHTERCISLMVDILSEEEGLTTAEIYTRLLDLGYRNIPTRRQVSSLLSHHPSKFEVMKTGEGSYRNKRIKYWRNKNAMDREIQAEESE